MTSRSQRIWRALRRASVALLLITGVGSTAGAQAEIVSAPATNYLLDITRNWSRASVLGDLSERPAGSVDIEARAWGGYGLTGVFGIIVRRAAGQWQAWRAEVVNCRISVPIPVGDTASVATRARFIAMARKNCGMSIGDTQKGASVFDADTLALTPIDVTSNAVERAWNRAVDASIRSLPPRIPRTWRMMDGFTYVIEVRLSDQYRASVIEHVATPEVDADKQVQGAFAALATLLRQ